MAIRDLIPWRKRHGEEGRAEVAPYEEPWDAFRDMMEEFFRPWAETSRMLQRGRMFPGPAVDVTESAEDYTVTVELPGMTRDDIEVTVEDGRLNIRGEKKSEKKEEEKNYLRVERSYGSFSRSIPLPTTVQEEAVEATFKDGVLRVKLPKTEEARGRKIEIKGGEAEGEGD
jgi:HSP20 family protein